MEILLTRHGQTEWNRMKKVQGRADIELNEKRLYIQTLYANFIHRVITQTEYKELRENYQNEIESLLAEIICLEEIQKNNSQKIEHIFKLKQLFQSTQISEITKEFSDKLIEKVEVSSNGTINVTFYFDKLLKEIKVNSIE